MTEILEEFGALRPGNTYVTDNAANMKLAMREYSWLGCAGHNLNLVLAHGLKEQSDSSDNDSVQGILQLIKVCKGIVSHVKRTRIQSKLETTLKQAVPTRWNSALTMLQSLLCNTADLKKLADEFGDRSLQRSLLDVNMDLLKEVVAVLEHFDTATRMLSTDRTPSLHLVYPTKKQLTKKLKPEAGDCAAITDLKSQLNNNLNDLFAVKPMHHLTTLLDPRLKTGVLSDEEKTNAVAALRKLADEVDLSSEDTSLEPSTKRRKVDKITSESDFFADLFESTEAVAADEVDSYLSSTASISDILGFWKSKETI